MRRDGGLALFTPSLVLALAILAVTPSAQANAASPMCRQAIGQVERLENGQWRLLRGGEPMARGQKVRTAALAFASFRLPGTGTLTLTGPAEVTLLPSGGAPLTVEAGEAHLSFEAPETRVELAGVTLSQAEPGTLVRVTRHGTATELVVVRGRAHATVGAAVDPLEAGEGVSSASGTFSVLDAPAITGPEPDERYFCPGLIVRLDWARQPKARAYRVEVAEDAAFSLLVLSRETGIARSQFVPRAPGRYFWRVSARDADGRWSPPSAAAPLFCEQDAPREHLRTPAAGATVAPPRPDRPLELAWDAARGAQAYRVVVARGDDLHAPTAIRRSTTAPRLVFDEPLPPGDYVWGVYVEDSYAGQPLFLRARPLKIRNAQKNPVKIPSALNQWGQ